MGKMKTIYKTFCQDNETWEELVYFGDYEDCLIWLLRAKWSYDKEAGISCLHYDARSLCIHHKNTNRKTTYTIK